MIKPWICFVIHLQFTTISYFVVQSGSIIEFPPRSLSPYGDGLESAQVLQIPTPSPDDLVLLSIASNVTQGCDLRNVTAYFRHGGLPIVNVYNASYPNYTYVYQPIDYEFNFLSDGQLRNVTAQSRQLSSVLFGVAFILEDVSRIQQQGLTRTCTTLFWGRAELVSRNSSIGDEGPPIDIAPTTLVRKNYAQPLNVKWVVNDERFSARNDVPLTFQPNSAPTYFVWNIVSPVDVGGTLQVDVKFEQNATYASIFGCLMHATPDCTNGSRFSASSSTPDSKAKVIVPYPLQGDWYLSLYANCTESQDTVCERNISVRLQVFLSSCQEGSCGAHGRCAQYFSAGLIYSACLCSSGYSGWGCSDDTNALSNALLLTSVLLLTLSNLFLLPAIYLSFRRGHYPQCLMYVITMLFSTFYHACDQQEFSFCLMPYSVLQFGDFYSALASVWLTALIVADLRVSPQIFHTLSLAGVVGIAVAVHYNPTSLPSFLVPIACGLFVIAVSWIRIGYQKKQCHPGKYVCLRAIVPCLVFSVVGLICFAFLETEDNYFYVHSIWHISIALAIVFVLPSGESDNRVTKL